ncbi:MarR family winged helix-turn-helix transcriptional regulator [Amycolatopsis sp. NPDC098790]|uniref:MarR family winged helix-turn-helix transcriptional regulator n=1 Tax=Amycolatopsis sp. NPDC098790 TaxID=3363939 RepID=UPI0037FF4767
MGTDARRAAGGGALNADETELWRAFLRFSGDVRSAVESALFAATGLSGADFQILARLHEAEECRLSQKQLGELMGWTATRLSHQLARMQGRGFVGRAPTGRGRLMTISLADRGLQAYESALPVHAQAVRAHFFSHLDPVDFETGLRFLVGDEPHPDDRDGSGVVPRRGRRSDS